MSELIEAIQQGDVERVQSLLESDPALLRRSHGAATPLLTAIYYGKNDVARLLVDRGAPVSFAEACALGDAELVARLLDADATVLDRRSSDGHTPLALSIFFRHPDVARMLIERGADVNAHAENAQRVA